MSMSHETPPTPRTSMLLYAAGLVIVVAGLKAAAELLLPFVLALFLAIISLPLVSFLERRRLPRTLAVLVTVLADFAVLVGVVLLVAGQFNAFTAAWPRYQARLGDIADTAQRWLASYSLDFEPVPLHQLFNPAQVVDLVSSTLRGVAGVVSKVVLVLLFMIFILLETHRVQDKLCAAFGSKIDLTTLSIALRDIQRYLGIKTGISLVTGLVIWLWVSVAGVDFAVLWGLLAFLLNYIPNLGSILAAIPAVLLAALQQGPGTALFVCAGFLLVNLALGNFLEPSLMGRRFGLSTLVVFLSLVFWGWVWGPVGMLLSVPLTMTLKIGLEAHEDLRWLAILLGGDPTPAVVSPSPPSTR